MAGWYVVSYVGWLVTMAHSMLTVYVVRELWFLDVREEVSAFYIGAVYMYALLIAILLVARWRKVKLFHANDT